MEATPSQPPTSDPAGGPPDGQAERRRVWSLVRTSLTRRWTATDATSGNPYVEVSLERATLFLALGIFGAGILGTLAATVGWFRFLAPIVIASTVIACAALVVFAARGRLRLRARWGDLDTLAVGIALAAALSAGVLQHGDWVGGWDTSLYHQSAITIADTGGRFTDLPTDASLPARRIEPGGIAISVVYGYPALAAYTAYAFGQDAVAWTNVPLVFVTVLSIYLTARALGGRVSAIAAPLAFQLNLATLWFNRWVMTENVLVALMFVSILLAVPLARGWDTWRAGGLAICFAYIILVRAEGFLVVGGILGVLALSWTPTFVRSVRDGTIRAAWRRVSRSARWGIGAMSLSVLVATGVVVRDRWLQIEAGFRLAKPILQGRPAADLGSIPTTGVRPNWGDYAFRYEWDSVMAYHLPWFLLLAALGLAAGTVPRRRGFLVIAFCLTYGMFILMPPITLFHPWFLRRLWVSVIPGLMVVGLVALEPSHVLARLGAVRDALARWRLERPIQVAAVGLCVLMVASQAVVAAPLALERQDSGVLETMEDVDALLPPSTLVLFDDHAEPLAPALRIRHDRPSLVQSEFPAKAIVDSLRSAEDYEHTFGVSFSLTQTPVFALDGVPGGMLETYTYAWNWSWISQDRFRDVLSTPPIEEGYAIFQAYLDNSVPPRELERLRASLIVVEYAQPLVLVRNVVFDPAEWDYGPVGMVANQADATLRVAETVLGANLTYRPYLHVVFPQGQTGPRTVYARDGANVTALGDMRLEGNRTLLHDQFALNQPLTYTSVDFPAGTILRGAYVGRPSKAGVFD